MTIAVDAIGSRAPVLARQIVVIGGGCYGSWYAGQLARAWTRGALQADAITVVDRDPGCRVADRLAEAAYGEAPVRLEVAGWLDFLTPWLAAGPEARAMDALVPSPLMPHLLLDWLMGQARARQPQRHVTVQPLAAVPPTPWERAAPDARHYVSFATWTCPVNCIEPARCPATRGPRDWSMPETVRAMAEGDAAIDGAVIFHCEHRTYGVGMVDAATIAAADNLVAHWSATGPARVLVGTVSHCHGALGVLSID